MRALTSGEISVPFVLSPAKKMRDFFNISYGLRPIRLSAKESSNSREEDMKCFRLIPYCFYFCIFTFAQVAKADNPESQAAPTASSMPARAAANNNAAEDEALPHNLGIGFDISQFKYEQPTDLREHKGTMFGVSGDYAMGWKRYQFMVDGNATWGDLDYTAGTARTNDIRNFLFDAKFAIGHDFGRAEKALLRPFFGLGVRYRSEETGGEVSSEGTFGPDRRDTYLYSPVGLQFLFPVGRRASLIPSGEYDIFWRGWQYTRLNDIDPTMPNVENIQTGGYGARGGVKVVIHSGNFDYFVEPYVKYWDIKDSKSTLVTIGDQTVPRYEPAHTSKEWGVRIGIRLF